jgi:methylated-DNA-[protein]-cysteine S-methyltransferase
MGARRPPAKDTLFARNVRDFCDRSHQKSYPETGFKTRTVNAMQCCLFPTELGWSAAIWSNSSLKELKIGHLTPAAALRGLSGFLEPTSPSRAAQRLIVRLQQFAEGTGDDDFLDVELDTRHLTDFGCAVTARCRQIAAGTTMSYGELATTAGYPGAARAVGSVMRRNRWPLIVPCHRVVAAGGHLGGFSAPNGLEMKRRLLNQEGSELATV